MYKRTLILIAALAASAAAQQPSADRRALIRLEDAWASGLVKRDMATFRRLLGKGFVYTEGDQMTTRDALLTDIATTTDTVTAAHNEDMTVHLFGASTGVVTGWLVTEGRGKAGAFKRRYRFTDTWVKSKGSWQIVAAQDFLAPK